MQSILTYITKKYEPDTIIVYGSYADGSNHADSDFDALVITERQCQSHDVSVIDGTLLDVFIYPSTKFGQDIRYEDYVQIYDGSIILDKHGVGAWLKNKVIGYIENMPPKTREENLTQIKWCEKMLLRAERNDMEGHYRWHWLLVDSLEIYFDICGLYYFGPKKSLVKMQEQDPDAASAYGAALSSFEMDALKNWILFLRSKYENRLGI